MGRRVGESHSFSPVSRRFESSGSWGDESENGAFEACTGVAVDDRGSIYLRCLDVEESERRYCRPYSGSWDVREEDAAARAGRCTPYGSGQGQYRLEGFKKEQCWRVKSTDWLEFDVVSARGEGDGKYELGSMAEGHRQRRVSAVEL